VCLKAGITCVQLREKSLPVEDLLDFGRSLKRLLDLYNVPLMVNDDIDLCIKLSAFGVHLGQSDKVHKIPGTFKVAFLDQLHNPDLLFMRDLYDSRR
jgi:thiamine-phosphate diphosphorylase